jgi:hypothetical protein
MINLNEKCPFIISEFKVKKSSVAKLFRELTVVSFVFSIFYLYLQQLSQ